MMKILHRSPRDFLPVRGHYFQRPLIIFQSDDWGLVGIRDQEGFNELRTGGLELGTRPYDFYSLETAEDLHHLYEVLLRHRDSVGRPPCFVFNFVVANVDFPRVIDSGFTKLHLLPLDEGLPGRWQRIGLLKGFREGIQKGLIYPALHGLTHFCQTNVEKLFRAKGEPSSVLRVLYTANTPMIPQRTPWAGFEYHQGPNGGENGWLDFSLQGRLIGEAKRLFERIFRMSPFSACAPGYRANAATLRGWKEAGIQVIQNGIGWDFAPYFDQNGLLHVHRNVLFEPAIDTVQFEESTAWRVAEEMIGAGRPAIVCMHSVNFHSTLRNHRDRTLKSLDRFLTRMEARYEDLLYVNDFDLYQIVKAGYLEWNGQRASVPIRNRLGPSPAAAYYLQKMGKSLTPIQMKQSPTFLKDGES